MADPVPLASAQVTKVQCTVFGLHLLPFRSDAAPAETISTLFFSRVTSATASDTEEVGTSRMRSAPSWSYHFRAIEEPLSGLFWWSAETISALMPLSAALKSSTAILAATTEPEPEMWE